MSEIKRYKLYDGCIYEHDYGHCVTYEDHIATIKQLETELEAAKKDSAKLYEIKQQFDKYESSEEHSLDIMFEYANLKELIDSVDATIKEQVK